MESAGYFVSPASEFAAGVEHGEYHLHGGKSGLFLYVYRDSTAIVNDRDGIVLVDLHINVRTESGQRLIYGIVHDFIYKMMKSSGRGAAYIHSRPFPYCFQSF